MSVNSHIDSLNIKHYQLERSLQDAYMHHLPVTHIKKQKLRIKDQIEGLLKQSDINISDMKDVA